MMFAPLYPFRPTDGAEPPRLVGREGFLDEFSYGLQIRTGAPGLLTIFTGARGVGKTVMLGETKERAQRAGWAVISETATRGFLGRIGQAMLPLIEELGSGPPTRCITGLGIAGVSIDTTGGFSPALYSCGPAGSFGFRWTAGRRNTRMVIGAALAAATAKDLEFLRAMAEDDGPSKTADIGRRLGNASNTIGNYRSRLIDAGLIESAGHGLVDFAIPGLRNYLRS